MNRTRKMTLIALSTLLLMCLCVAAAGSVAVRSAGRVLTRGFEDDPQTVAAVGDDIAAYDLPAGFGDAYAAELAGFSLVTYTGDDDHSHISLLQMPGVVRLDQAEMERQMRQASHAEAWTDLVVVARQPCRIRGEESTLVISEGVNHDNQRYRSASALFAGKGGTAVVNISMPVSRWDQDVVDNFIVSLR